MKSERERVSTAYYASPLGIVELRATTIFLLSCRFVEQGATAAEASASPLLRLAQNQLDAYFRGGLREFSVPLSLRGSPFQCRVWSALQQIPFASSCAYRDIARQLGQPNAARAVGNANHGNPLALFIPCHRVLRSDGTLGGYAASVWRKRWLLTHEQRVAAR